MSAALQQPPQTEPDSRPLIRLKNIYKRFGKNVVLNGINLSIYRGQITSIIGKSGGGKSVLLKHIIGLIEQDSGDIFFSGKPPREMSSEEKSRLKDKFSYMFQGTALFDSMTVFENIALPLKEKKRLAKAKIREKVHEQLTQLDLEKIDNKYPSQLSGGMQKRVALARALVTDPEIVLFDEPTTGLDPIRKNAVHTMISDYQKQYGFTGVIVSHDIPDIFHISQRIAMLNEGRIIFEGDYETLQETDKPQVLEFLHGEEVRHDKLTGIPPQTQGEKRFKEEMGRLDRYEYPFSMILFTLENLEDFHREMKYNAEKNPLKEFTSLLRTRLRVSDICSRFGRNQVTVMLPNTDSEQARTVCDKMKKGFQEQEIAPSKETTKAQPDSGAGLNAGTDPGFCLSVSVGITEVTLGETLQSAVQKAESNRDMFHQCTIC